MENRPVEMINKIKLLVICMISLLCFSACSAQTSETVSEQASSLSSTSGRNNDSTGQTDSVETGVRKITANGAVYPVYTMLDAIVIEYDSEIVLPEQTVSSLYTITDEAANGNERAIEAIYMNDQPMTRADQQSMPGRYVIIQLERIENPNPQSDAAWQPDSLAGMALQFQSGSYVHTFRTDYSDLHILQEFDAVNEEGAIIQRSGNLPTLNFQDISWPETEGFAINNVLDSAAGEIHYSFYLPEDYDPAERYPLVVVVPGYNGMLLSLGEETVGINVFTDRSALVWTQQEEEMIVLAPQLETWGETAADQVIELVEYVQESYSIDTERIYAMGYSAGGEIMSRVLDMQADLFAAYLHVSSRWVGEVDTVIAHRLPVYIFMAENDEYYGSQAAREAYRNIEERYRKDGFTSEQISELVTLHIPDNLYFNRQGIYDYHAGGQYVTNDEAIVRWLLNN